MHSFVIQQDDDKVNMLKALTLILSSPVNSPRTSPPSANISVHTQGTKVLKCTNKYPHPAHSVFWIQKGKPFLWETHHQLDQDWLKSHTGRYMPDSPHRAYWQCQPIHFAFLLEYTRGGFSPKSVACLFPCLKQDILPACEELVSWFFGILGLKFQTCESEVAAAPAFSKQGKPCMVILMGLEWARVCASEGVSLNHTSDRSVYLRLKEDVLLLTHFHHGDEARYGHWPSSPNF